MALSNIAEYLAREANPPLRLGFNKAALTTIAGRQSDSWVTGALGASAPTTAVAPTKTTTGAIGIEELRNVSYALRLLGANISSNVSGTFMLCDRLSHNGGMASSPNATVTTNLPTAALTRYTSGAGVHIGLSIYTQLGTTATTATASYTNQAGTSGQVTPAVTIGGTGFREASRFIMLPFAAGDTGARAVASVTIGGTGTGTAGAFGVTLYRPIAMYIIERPGGQQRFNLLDGMGGFVRDLEADPCLFWVYTPNITSTVLSGNLHFAEAT